MDGGDTDGLTGDTDFTIGDVDADDVDVDKVNDDDLGITGVVVFSSFNFLLITGDASI